MTEDKKFVDVSLSLKENTYWKLVAIAAKDQLTVEDWLDEYLEDWLHEYLPAVLDNLVNEKN